MIEDRREETLNPSCKEFQANLEDYLEGQMPGGLPAHASKCPACGALLADLGLIRAAARRWPLESPGPQVWSNIRATLETEGFFQVRESLWKRWPSPFGLSPIAAPVGAVVFLIVLAIFLLSPGDLYRRPQPASAPPLATESMASASLNTVEENLVRTVQGMEKSYRSREAYLDPAAQKTYDRGLTSLDSSIHECLVSLQAQPQNALAHQYLMEAYSEKADVLASALEYDGR